MYDIKDNFPSIRILPMSKEEFGNADYTYVQNDFFLNVLKNREYRFKALGMKADNGTLVLFQYVGKIIAMAKLEDTVFFEEPIDALYTGGYVFDSKSIVVFDPLTKEEVKGIWQEFKQFSQSKQYLNPKDFDKLHKVLTKKRMKYAIS